MDVPVFFSFLFFSLSLFFLLFFTIAISSFSTNDAGYLSCRGDARPSDVNALFVFPRKKFIAPPAGFIAPLPAIVSSNPCERDTKRSRRRSRREQLFSLSFLLFFFLLHLRILRFQKRNCFVNCVNNRYNLIYLSIEIKKGQSKVKLKWNLPFLITPFLIPIYILYSKKILFNIVSSNT